MTKSQTSIARRTDALLARFKGNRNEFQMLKGVLCMEHGLEGEDRALAASLFDGNRIAQRLDEINAEDIAKYRAASLINS